ncbi:hypothetical protein HID58_056889 [Brassica napus]|uniref:Uncharacterized protein n=2 Tax=Brassica napus TaxID=3708 RepID=A0ABQ8AR24_BRANA|nr:hypothetical protein HID58_056889 [Brassica napus]
MKLQWRKKVNARSRNLIIVTSCITRASYINGKMSISVAHHGGGSLLSWVIRDVLTRRFDLESSTLISLKNSVNGVVQCNNALVPSLVDSLTKTLVLYDSDNQDIFSNVLGEYLRLGKQCVQILWMRHMINNYGNITNSTRFACNSVSHVHFVNERINYIALSFDLALRKYLTLCLRGFLVQGIIMSPSEAAFQPVRNFIYRISWRTTVKNIQEFSPILNWRLIDQDHSVAILTGGLCSKWDEFGLRDICPVYITLYEIFTTNWILGAEVKNLIRQRMQLLGALAIRKKKLTLESCCCLRSRTLTSISMTPHILIFSISFIMSWLISRTFII